MKTPKINFSQLSPFIVFCIAFLLPMSSAHAMRCGTHLISQGDLALKAKEHCGEPDWVDRWYEEVVLGEQTDFEHRIGNVIERWVYNLGPNQFMRFMTVRNNRIESIETGSYGFDQVKTANDCDSNVFNLGISSIEVEAKCGQPDSKSRQNETLTRPLAPGARQKVTIAVDEWVYNLGPQNFVRILTFENGYLTDIKTGPRGF